MVRRYSSQKLPRISLRFHPGTLSKLTTMSSRGALFQASRLYLEVLGVIMVWRIPHLDRDKRMALLYVATILWRSNGEESPRTKRPWIILCSEQSLRPVHGQLRRIVCHIPLIDTLTSLDHVSRYDDSATRVSCLGYHRGWQPHLHLLRRTFSTFILTQFHLELLCRAQAACLNSSR